MKNLLPVIAVFLTLFDVCVAICCNNHKPLCFVNSIECDPNCSDGISYCDYAEACMNDSWGGCYDIQWHTQYWYYNIRVDTVYTATETQYSTETSYDYVATVSGDDVYVTSTIVATSTETETAPAPTITVAPKLVRRAKGLLKRDNIDLTSSVNWDCSSYEAPICSSTVQGFTTEVAPYTEIVQATQYDSGLNYITTYHTSYDVTTYTYTPDTVTVVGDETPSPLPDDQDTTTSESDSDPTPTPETDNDPISTSNSDPGPTFGAPDGGPNPSEDGTSTFSTVVVPTAPPSNSRDSAALAVLQTAVPDNVKSDAAGACFLFTQYTSAYTTPTWYTGLATDVQSYFSSANAQNTAACSPTPVPDEGKGFSSGAKGGIAAGAIAGAAILGGLAYLIYSKFFAAKPAAQAQPDNSGDGWQDNSGQPWQHQDNGGQAWQNNAGQPDTTTQSVSPIGSGNEMSQTGGWSGVTGDPSGGGWNGVTGDPTGGAWNGVTGSSPPTGAMPSSSGPHDELFFLAAANRRRRSREDQRSPPPGHNYSNQLPSPGMYTPPAPSQYSVPRRDVPSRAASGLSGSASDPFADYGGRGVGAASPGNELSTSGALRGQEAGGYQRFEAPSMGGAYFQSEEVEGRQRYEAPTEERQRYEAPEWRHQ